MNLGIMILSIDIESIIDCVYIKKKILREKFQAVVSLKQI